MTPKVPTIESGTATAGMMVAASDRRKRKMTMTTSAMVRTSSNSTSLTEARMVLVRSVRTSRSTLGRKRGAQLWEELGDLVDDADDVGAGLPLDVEDDGGLEHSVARGGGLGGGLGGGAHPGGLVEILGAVDGEGDVGQAHGGAVAVGDDDVVVVGRGEQLIVGADGVGLAGAVERSLGLIDVGGAEGGADVFERQAVVGQRGGVGLDADGGLLAAVDGDETDAGELRDFLGEKGVGEVFDFGELAECRW